MNIITTKLGHKILVDSEDYDRLSKNKWNVNNGYAVNWKIGSMARYIMNTDKGMNCDHINHNTLDNRRSNLRNCTITENHYNTKKRLVNTSGLRGVSKHKLTGKWEARIRVMGKKLYLGLFDNKEDAYKKYLKAERQYHEHFSLAPELQ